MIESHLALVYSTRGSATARLNRPGGLNLSNTYTLEGTEEGREGKECSVTLARDRFMTWHWQANIDKDNSPHLTSRHLTLNPRDIDRSYKHMGSVVI